ncbi:MAG: S1/P1 nuclease [Xanthomonadales bacterium]|nr:S1/P1 nuclease [Xanthomonadales bacterium]
MAHSGVLRAGPASVVALLRILCLLLIALPALALAWGPAGHRMVGELAARQLTPAAKAETRRLLGGQSLADVAPWADELRNDPGQRALWRETAPLHFVNFAGASCRYVARRDCPDGRCIVAGIERYAAVLGDRTRPDAQRAEALRFLVHFVADVHQPLHAGYRPDRGGNRYQVRWNGRGTNLHAVWDSPVLASRRLGWKAHADVLARRPRPRATGESVAWAEESCRATRDGGLYPKTHVLDGNYAARMRPLAEQRVLEAAARLAALLNRQLDASRQRSGKR